MVCSVNSYLLGAPCPKLCIYGIQLLLRLYWSLNIPFCVSGQPLLSVTRLKPQHCPIRSIFLSASSFIKTGYTLIFIYPHPCLSQPLHGSEEASLAGHESCTWGAVHSSSPGYPALEATPLLSYRFNSPPFISFFPSAYKRPLEP